MSISSTDDIIEIRDVIDRVEELEDEISAFEEEAEPEAKEVKTNEENKAELELLAAFLEECRDNGGDEAWREHWYPRLAIHESYFQEHAKELAEDLGLIYSSQDWPLNCIDWERAADELQRAYAVVEFEHETYYVR